MRKLAPSTHIVRRNCVLPRLQQVESLSVVKYIDLPAANERALRYRNQPTEQTTMSDPHLPAETLDHIVNHLHDTQDALKNCCLVSKSWIPRARKHLFADVKFLTAGSLQSWKKTFPNPSTSPACYAKTVSVNPTQVVVPADAEEGGWIRRFSHAAHLELDLINRRWFPSEPFSLVSFHGFSPVLKSLRVTVLTPSSPGVFDLILSFPLLEDLAVLIPRESADNGGGPAEDEIPPPAQLSSPPMFTGSLELLLERGMKSFTRQLLSLPGGIHFRMLTLTWIHEEDPLLIMALVEECSHSLESLDITGQRTGTCV
jgi:hypothetical protein